MTGNNVYVFAPKNDLTAAENMKRFIHACREELTIYEPNFCWEENLWSAANIGFGNLDQGSTRAGITKPLESPFLDFAKAYFRYRHTHTPNEHRFEIRALRCVERALMQANGAANPSDINIAILDEAAQVAQGHYKSAYKVGLELQKLAKFLTNNGLIGGSLDWQNPINRPSDVVRTGSKAKELREAKLPNQDALDAIAEVFSRNPQHSADIFVTSTVAMLLCAPSRISEIISLTLDCEVEDKKRDGSTAYGWRFRPAKGGAPMIKWIPDVMVDIAKEAVDRLRQITKPARDLAAWLETGDTQFVPELDALLRSYSEIEKATVMQLVGSRSLEGLTFSKVGGKTIIDTGIFIRWLRNAITQDYKFFPFLDKKKTVTWRNALFSFRQNELNYLRIVDNYGLSCPDNNTLNNKLTKIGLKMTASFFSVHGYNEGRDDPLGLTSHQFRHLLVTIANRGGLSGIEVARWRGSKDVRQNRTYNQQSEFELVALLRKHDPALIRSKSELEIAEQIRMALPVTTAEFNALEKQTAHITEFGFCVHNFVMSPCTRFRDCLNCTEQVCVKGDRRLKRLREQLDMVDQQLASAAEGAAEGLYGVDPWTHIQQQTRDRLVSLISILEDPAIPDGATIRLANPREFSPARRALRTQGLGLQPRLAGSTDLSSDRIG